MVRMAEYIEREALLRKAVEEKRFVFQMEDLLNNEVVFQTVYKDLADFILSAPAADVAPVVHGEWVKGYPITCSACGGYAATEYEDANIYKAWNSPYCPNCGADMRKRRNDDAV